MRYERMCSKKKFRFLSLRRKKVHYKSVKCTYIQLWKKKDYHIPNYGADRQHYKATLSRLFSLAVVNSCLMVRYNGDVIIRHSE